MVGHLDDQLKTAAHPNCMYKWMNYIVSPQVERRGGAVLRRGAGAEQGVRAVHADGRREGRRVPPDPKFCDKYHAADPGFWKRVYYWTDAGGRLRR